MPSSKITGTIFEWSPETKAFEANSEAASSLTRGSSRLHARGEWRQRWVVSKSEGQGWLARERGRGHLLLSPEGPAPAAEVGPVLRLIQVGAAVVLKSSNLSRGEPVQ
jgi:hypothetical protein